MWDSKSKVLALASDHAGFARKQAIIKYFDNNGIAYKDLGSYTEESVDYPIYAHKIAEAIEKGEFEMGFTFCGSGQGISIAANKHAGIRSAVCWIPEIASLARQHNNANICAIPGRFVTDDEAIAIAKAFLEADFEGGRHERRIEQIPLH